MLDLHRLRLLRELEARGTIAAVADALRFTPSAVSQQLSVLEREAGVPLLERAGRGVRLTDAARVLVTHADVLLERAERAEAALAAASGIVAGRARIASFQSAALHLAVPAMHALAQEAPALRCELVEAEPEQSLPTLPLGEVDLVLGDEWQHQPLPRLRGIDREDLLDDPVFLVLPAAHPTARRHRRAVPLGELAGEPWTTGHRDTRSGWEEVIVRTCRELGGFEPDIRHRPIDSAVAIALVAHGLGVTLLPALALGDHAGVVRRPTPVTRAIFAATRAADAARPSTQALVRSVQAASAEAAAVSS